MSSHGVVFAKLRFDEPISTHWAELGKARLIDTLRGMESLNYLQSNASVKRCLTKSVSINING